MPVAATFAAEMGMEGSGFRFTWNEGPITYIRSNVPTSVSSQAAHRFDRPVNYEAEYATVNKPFRLPPATSSG
ncbi:Uncharacterised protein [Mycobacteroides abscessus subsp. abscessus]|nr:Uncharacterised protein [Mycobacteroides abscessus subsp. abscessus]